MDPNSISQQMVDLKFIPLHIDTFQQEGKWFARGREFQVITHGNSEIQAARNVFNMIVRSVLVAGIQGTLPDILKRAGVQLVLGVPEEPEQIVGTDGTWFVPVTPHAHFNSGP